MSKKLETKPDAGGDQAVAEEPTNPETGVETEGGQPSGAEQTEPSRENKVEALERKLNDVLRGMNAAQREAAEAKAQADFYRQQTQALAGMATPQKDEEASAWERFQQTYSPEDLKTWQSIREQKLAATVEQRVMAQSRLAQSLPAAREMLGVTDDATLGRRLASVHQTLTPDELALVDLRRQGKLNDWLAEDQKARERRAKEAALAGAYGMAPGGQRVPGQPGGPKKRVVIPWGEWSASNDEAKARVRKDLNNPDVEYVFADVPANIKQRGFDPTKD